MPDFNNSLFISSTLVSGENSCLQLIGSSSGHVNNQYYVYENKRYPDLMFMKFGKTDFYIITDRYIGEMCVLTLLNTVYWKRETSNYSGRVKTNDNNWLHRFLLSQVNNIDNENIVHHLGHTFDNRVKSLKLIPNAEIHGEIHGIYEKCERVNVNRPHELNDVPDVRKIDSVQELIILLNEITSPNYLVYRNYPNTDLYSTDKTFYTKSVKLREYVK